MTAAAFLVDASDPIVAINHVAGYWLTRLDELDFDDATLEGAERGLDRAAYRSEQAARRIRAHRRARAAEHADASSGTVPHR